MALLNRFQEEGYGGTIRDYPLSNGASNTCPFGLLAKRMLEEAGLDFDDRILGSREAVDEFKAAQGVATTPQIFIDEERIGGSEELARFLETDLQD